MKDSANIRVKVDHAEVMFEWLGFDGDDCFGDFYIEIANGTEARRFDFGPCVTWGLRKAVKFFEGKLDTTSSGFRVPDIRTYELTRTDDGFLLEIRFEANNQYEQFHLSKPAVAIDYEFLSQYDGES